jgi:hypothetical protein
MFDRAAAYWRTLASDEGARFDREVVIDAGAVRPHVSWGTSPEMVVTIDDRVPDPAQQPDAVRRAGMQRALADMGLAAGTPMTDIRLDKVFIGSRTNARIEDLRAAAAVARGGRVAPTIRQALVVPGSGFVKAKAESEGLDRIFRDAGFEWLEPGERCASTSNRNFEGRQGPGGRSHLVSPAMAAAAAIAGRFVDVTRCWPCRPSRHSSRWRSRWTGPTSTPTRSSPSSSSTRSARPASARSCSTSGATSTAASSGRTAAGDRCTPTSCSTSRASWAPGSCSHDRTSAAARRASPRSGRWPKPGSGSSSPRASPTSSTATASGTGCCRPRWKTRSSTACSSARPRRPGCGCASTWRRGRALDGGAAIAFPIDAGRRHRLLQGLDDIGLTLPQADRIHACEAQRRGAEPWLFG